MSFALKKAIKKELVSLDWAGKVEETAVAALAEILEERHGGQLDALHDILKYCNSDLSADGKVTVATVRAALAPSSGGGAQQVEMVEFTDAFSVPRLVFDAVQRKLNVDSKPRTIHATAEAKHQVYLQRLLLIQQRLQRSRMFQQSNLLLPNSSNGGFSVQLTDLQSLRGVFGVTRYVLGYISRAEDGRYLLEDTTGSVPLDLSTAETAAGFYTENCVVIAEGSMGHDGAFHVRALGLPPCEPRSSLPSAAQRLNSWGGAGGGLDHDSEARAFLMEEEARRGPADRVVVLANVWLDRAEVLDSLHTLLAAFSGVETVPAVFVLMGNFHSRAGAGGGASGGAGGSRAGGGGADGMLSGGDVDYGTMRELFGQLAALIDNYPRLKAESRFVFMPGPDDPGPGAILPQPPLPRSLTGELRRLLPTAVFASNPCRLRYGTQRIVLFRHDLQRRLRRRTLLPLSGAPDGSTSSTPSDPAASQASGPSSTALWGHLALTLLQQGHLAPLPLLAQPVYWQYDSAMSLYPLPDAVIVADATAGQEEFSHEGCRVINPGCLPGGFFAAYLPCVQQVEMSELPRPGQELEVEQAVGEDDGQEADAEGREGDDGERAEAAEAGPGERAGGRAPLQQRQVQQQQRAQKAGGKTAKARKPRKAAGAGGGKGQRQLQVQRQLAGEDGDGDVEEADAADGDAAVDGDVEMAEGEPQPQAGHRGGGAVAVAAAGGKAKAKVKGKALAAAAAAPAGKAGGAKQGTLAQAWAKQPVAVRLEDGLEDDVDGGGAAAGPRRSNDGGDSDVEMVEEDGAEKGPAAAGRRRQQQARKRRAMVVEEEEEEDGGTGAAPAAARTWADDDDEADGLEDGE